MGTSWTWEWATREESAVGAVESTLLDVRWPDGRGELATHLSESELREVQRELPRRLSFSVAQRTALIAALACIREHEARGHRAFDAPAVPELEAAYRELWNAALDKNLGLRELLSLIQVSHLRLQQQDPARDQRIRVLRGLGPRQAFFNPEQRETLATLAFQLARAEDELQRCEAERRLSWIAAARGLSSVQLVALIEEGFELPLRGLEG